MKLKNSSCIDLKQCVSQKIEINCTSNSNKILGGRLFNENKLELKPFPAVPFTGWGDWQMDPLKNRSWQWKLNCFSFLPALLAYHHAVKTDGIIDMGKAAIESWLGAYLQVDTSYPFEFIWHDHGTAARAEQLVLFQYYCCQHAPSWTEQNTKFLDYLEHALLVHGRLLAQDDFYSEHTNHGLIQARALLLLSDRPDSCRARLCIY